MNDPLLDELRRQRRHLAESFDNDLTAWLKTLRMQAAQSDQPHCTVPLKPRRQPTVTSPVKAD